MNTATDRPAYLTDEDQIGGNDPALRDFWEEANRLATESGQCHVYDELAKALGGPGRLRPHSIRMQVTVNLDVEVQATSREEALATARNSSYSLVSYTDPEDVEMVRRRFESGYYAVSVND